MGRGTGFPLFALSPSPSTFPSLFSWGIYDLGLYSQSSLKTNYIGYLSPTVCRGLVRIISEDHNNVAHTAQNICIDSTGTVDVLCVKERQT